MAASTVDVSKQANCRAVPIHIDLRDPTAWLLLVAYYQLDNGKLGDQYQQRVIRVPYDGGAVTDATTGAELLAAVPPMTAEKPNAWLSGQVGVLLQAIAGAGKL